MRTCEPSTARNAIRKRIAALFVPVACLLCAVSIAYAADISSVTFTLDFPNSSPEHYAIMLQSNGQAHYESSGRISNDSDARDDYQTDFTFSETTRNQIFKLAKDAHYFSGKIDSGSKKVAFTGAKKLA